eukprot:12086-Prorocentrum_minimum.AAC.1
MEANSPTRGSISAAMEANSPKRGTEGGICERQRQMYAQHPIHQSPSTIHPLHRGGGDPATWTSSVPQVVESNI